MLHMKMRDVQYKLKMYRELPARSEAISNVFLYQTIMTHSEKYIRTILFRE